MSTEPIFESGYISKPEVAALLDISKQTHFYSEFNFLSSHNGWRKRALHVIMGVPHGGKSTLVRTLILDAIGNKTGKNVGLWLSEESVQDFKAEFALSGLSDLADKLYLFSEQDNPHFAKVGDLLATIKRFIEEKDLGLLIFDNVTTSQCYGDKKPNEQAVVANAFKQIAKDTNIPIVPIVHTKKGISDNYDKLIDMDDIFGSGSFAKIANFFYIMQSFHAENNRTNTIKIVKHRGQEVNYKMFKLFYYKKNRVFGKDEIMSFNDFKDAFKKRMRL